MGSLDPTAEEFRPTNPNHLGPPPPPPPPQPYVFPYPVVQLQTTPFLDHTSVGVTCPQFGPATLSTSPTRSLLLSLVPSETTESTTALKEELEAFGDVRGVQMEQGWLCGDGMAMATVHFYDLRHAEAAFTAIRWHHMHYHTRLRSHHYYYPPAARVVWAQYIVPACADGQNQGTIVVFNLDPKVDAHSLRQIFEAFGDVKELRHTALKRKQRFVEYFDIRDAARALKQMNGKEIHGRALVIEFSRPAAAGRGHYCSSSNNLKPPPHHHLKPTLRPHYDYDEPSSVTKGTTGDHQDNKATTANLNLVSDNDEATTAALDSVNLNDKERQQYSEGPPKRNNCMGGRSSRNYWNNKGGKQRHAKKQHDARFLIKEQDAALDSSYMDSRTTLMIKNIPNKYSLKLLLNMLDTHCNHCNEQIGEDDHQPLSSYDFVYLPIDFNNRCNVGYGFVNMTSPEATLRLYKAFHNQHWQLFNSRKICEVTYARLQGLEAVKEHFKNSKFPYEMEQECLPVVFSPPRDGRQLTQPLAILGSTSKHQKQKQHQLIPTSTLSLIAAPDHHDLLCTTQNGGVETDADADDDDHSTGGASCSCSE